MANAADVQSLNVNPVRSSEIQSPLGTCSDLRKIATDRVRTEA